MFEFKRMGKNKQDPPEETTPPEETPPEETPPEETPPEGSEEASTPANSRMTRQEKKAWRRKNRKAKELEKDASAAAE